MNCRLTVARHMLDTWLIAYKITSVRLEYSTDLGLLLCANIVKYNVTAFKSQVKHKTKRCVTVSKVYYKRKIKRKNYLSNHMNTMIY
jgi:hypothetical protein